MFEGLVVARAVHFSATFLVFGGAFYGLAVAPRSLDAALSASRARTRGLIGIAAVVAVLTGLAWLAFSIANMTGDPGSVTDPQTLHTFFTETPFGRIAEIRLGFFALLLALAVRHLHTRRRQGLVALVAAALLVSQAWLGHAAEGGTSLVGIAMIAAYAVHVVAGAAWLGGIPPLLFGLLEAKAREPAIGLVLLLRYSAMAFVAVACVLASGIANIAFRIGTDMAALWSSGYGRVLLAKLAVVAAILALACLNRFVLVPRLEHAPRAKLITQSASLLVADLGLSALVLAIAAILGVTPPPF